MKFIRFFILLLFIITGCTNNIQQEVEQVDNNNTEIVFSNILNYWDIPKKYTDTQFDDTNMYFDFAHGIEKYDELVFFTDFNSLYEHNIFTNINTRIFPQISNFAAYKMNLYFVSNNNLIEYNIVDMSKTKIQIDNYIPSYVRSIIGDEILFECSSNDTYYLCTYNVDSHIQHSYPLNSGGFCGLYICDTRLDYNDSYIYYRLQSDYSKYAFINRHDMELQIVEETDYQSLSKLLNEYQFFTVEKETTKIFNFLTKTYLYDYTGYSDIAFFTSDGLFGFKMKEETDENTTNYTYSLYYSTYTGEENLLTTFTRTDSSYWFPHSFSIYNDRLLFIESGTLYMIDLHDTSVKTFKGTKFPQGYYSSYSPGNGFISDYKIIDHTLYVIANTPDM